VNKIIESPQREWSTYLIDNSKMTLTMVFLHIANVALAMVFSAEDKLECHWYFVNFCADIFGILIFSFVYSSLFNWLFEALELDFEVGEYGLAPKATAVQ
jgi:hypothetical protein